MDERMSDFAVCDVAEFPTDEAYLEGTGKFRSPRLHDGRIPLLRLPESTVLQYTDFKGKMHMHVHVNDLATWAGLEAWLHVVMSVPDDTAPRHRIVRRDGEHDHVRIRVYSGTDGAPSIFDANGTLLADTDPTDAARPGARVSCLVDLGCAWQTKDEVEYGLTLSLVQMRVACPSPIGITALSEDIDAGINDDGGFVAVQVAPKRLRPCRNACAIVDEEASNA